MKSLQSVRTLCQVMRENQRDPIALLRLTAIDPEQLEQPTAEIPFAKELQFVSLFLKVMSDKPNLAYWCGQRFRLVHYGAFGMMMLSSASLRSAIVRGIELQHLIWSRNKFTWAEQGRQSMLIMNPFISDPDLKNFYIARDLSALLTLLDDLWGGRFPMDVIETSVPAVEHNVPERLKGIEIRFNQPENRFIFSTSLLDTPLPQADPVLASFYHQQCQLLKHTSEAGGELTLSILSRLRNGNGNGQMISMEQMAGELGVSGRTLRRKLESEGSSYRELIGQVQQFIAKDLLFNSDMPIAGIAERLGYAETASFNHAFNRWTGMSPSVYRKLYLEQTLVG